MKVIRQHNPAYPIMFKDLKHGDVFTMNADRSDINKTYMVIAEFLDHPKPAIHRAVCLQTGKILGHDDIVFHSNVTVWPDATLYLEDRKAC